MSQSALPMSRPQTAAIIVPESRKIDLSKPYWTEARKILAPKASDGEFLQFAQVCRTTLLNPYAKEIFWIPNIGPFVSHKGYWALANRDPLFKGFAEHEYYWEDKDGVVNRERRGAIFSVKGAGHWKAEAQRFPVVQECLYREWAVKSNANWQSRPEYFLTIRTERCILYRMYPISGAILGVGIDEEAFSEMAKALPERSIDALKEEVPPVFQVGSGEVEQVPLASLAHGSPIPAPAPEAGSAAPAAQKPAVSSEGKPPEFMRAEIFKCVSRLLGRKGNEMTGGQLLGHAFGQERMASEAAQKITDPVKLEAALERLKALEHLHPERA